MNTSIATKSITNTQLAVATFIMLGAGSVALATVPLKATEVCEPFSNGIKIVDKYGIKLKSYVLTNGCQMVGQNNKKQDLTYSCVKRNSSQYNVSAKECANSISSLPDLVPTGLTFYTQPDGSISYTFSFTNKGTAEVSIPFTFDLGILKSNLESLPLKIGTIATYDDYVQEQIISDFVRVKSKPNLKLPPGSSEKLTGSIPLSLVQQGATKMIVAIDSGSSIKELQEFNSMTEGWVPMPNLVSFNTYFTPKTAGALDFEFIYINNGEGTITEPFDVSFVIEKNDGTIMPPQNGLKIPSIYNQKILAPHQLLVKISPEFPLPTSWQGKITGSIPLSAMQEGAAKLRVGVDSNMVIKEIDEKDNSVSFEIPNTQLPDLIVKKTIFKKNDDGTIHCQLLVSNEGNTDAHGPFRFGIMGYKIDGNQFPSAQIGPIPVIGGVFEEMQGNYMIDVFDKEYVLQPGAGATLNLSIPKSFIDQGLSKLDGKIDLLEEVKELNEYNNQFSADLP